MTVWATALTVVGIAVSTAAQAGPDPLPAQPPFGGAIWSYVVPALLFAIAFGATILLYRHFAGRHR
jgi:hypothetical protein